MPVLETQLCRDTFYWLPRKGGAITFGFPASATVFTPSRRRSSSPPPWIQQHASCSLPVKRMFVHSEAEAIEAGVLLKPKEEPQSKLNPSVEDMLDVLGEEDAIKFEEAEFKVEWDEPIPEPELEATLVQVPPAPKSSKMPGRWASIDPFGGEELATAEPAPVLPSSRPIWNHVLEYKLPKPDIKNHLRHAGVKLDDPSLDYLDHIRAIPKLTGRDPMAYFEEFEDLPWPVHGWPERFSDLRDEDIRAFYNSGPMAMLSRGRMMQTYRLWNPDNFARRTKGRVVVNPKHYAEVRRGMKRVARVVLAEAKKREQRVSGKVMVASPRKKRHRMLLSYHIPIGKH